MQPQGQDTPQPTPNPTPDPMPQDMPPPPTPSPEPTFAPSQHGVMPNTPTHQSKKPPVMLIGAIIGAVVLIGVGVFAYFMFFMGISLEAYSGEKYAMQVPVGYTKEEDADAVTFTEPGDKATASSVFAYYAEFPSTPTNAQLDAAKSTFKKQLETQIDSYTSSTHTVSDVKVEDTTFKGQEAFKVSAKAKSGASEGVVKLIAVIDSEKIFIVGVAADGSDAGLIAKSDEIINSFTIK